MRFSKWDWEEHGFTLSKHYMPLDVVSYACNFESWRFRKTTFNNQRQAILAQGLQTVENCVYEPNLYQNVKGEKECGFVYFYAWDVRGPFKIGSSLNPCGRLKGLQTGLPYHLRAYKVIFCNHKTRLETELHRLFRSQKMKGEWFDIDAHFIEWGLSRYVFHDHLAGFFHPMENRPLETLLEETIDA